MVFALGGRNDARGDDDPKEGRLENEEAGNFAQGAIVEADCDGMLVLVEVDLRHAHSA